MYYLIYKITNKINDKIYIGCHKTENPNDNYMGSGKKLKSSQKKYGIENFEKEILHFCDNKENMFQMESKLVNEEFVNRKDTYNLKEGGFGDSNWDTVNKFLTKEMRIKNALKPWGDKNRQKKLSQEISIRNKKLHKEGIFDNHINSPEFSFLGKRHTKKTKQKIGKANSKLQKGKGNSQYGTCWIYSLEEKKSIKIKKNQLKSYTKKGWTTGRKMKW